MNKEYYLSEYQHGFLTACFPVNLKKIAFILKDLPEEEDRREPDEMSTRILAYLAERNPVGMLGTVEWKQGVTKAYVAATKENNWIVCANNFHINEVISETQWYDMPNKEKGRLAKGIVYIDGHTYSYGMIRSVYKHTDVKQWENITTKSKHPNLFSDIERSKDNLVGDWVGFSALDGFNGRDIYAGGNRGDCWHYNGIHWSKIDLPLNSDISSITCTPDGKVYIGCRTGPVLVGRDDLWEVIDESKQIIHSAWFKDRIYFSSVNGRIYTHNNADKLLTEANFKTPYPKYMHHHIYGLASCDECLVIYTDIQAYAYDGENWHEIIEIPSLSKNK